MMTKKDKIIIRFVAEFSFDFFFMELKPKIDKWVIGRSRNFHNA
jgi:hypothetical protein